MALNDLKIRSSKPSEKQQKLFDSDGLFLLITPQGGKYFRLKYRFDRKEKLLALGTYPEISLADARQRRDEARRQVAHGIDPAANRKAQKQAKTKETDTLEVIAREWHGEYAKTWSTVHANTILVRLEKEVFPWLGGSPY